MNLSTLLKYLAIFGNGLFILWMLYNGMDEGWRATPIQLANYIGLTVLLLLNSFLILRRDKHS